MQVTSRPSGFTIVELLIVIVVIAILAAITIVSYNGIQNRATAAAYQADASLIAKKAELFNTDNGAYPTATSTFTADAAHALPANVAITYTSVGASSIQNRTSKTQTSPALSGTYINSLYVNTDTGLKTYAVRSCGAGTGLRIFYPDPTGTTKKDIIVGLGC